MLALFFWINEEEQQTIPTGYNLRKKSGKDQQKKLMPSKGNPESN